MPNEVTLGFESQGGSAPSAEQSEAKAAPTSAVPDDARASLMPPQGAGAPRRLYSTGSPTGHERLNVAMKVLRDPVARSSFSRVYSGQARSWHR
jgi:hypothetical protein